MNATELDVVSEVTPDDEICHVACCLDGDHPVAAFCGYDLEGARQVPHSRVECVVCIDLERSAWCPRLTVCPEMGPR